MDAKKAKMGMSAAIRFTGPAAIPGPEAVVLLVTSRCNAACVYCPFHQKILDFESEPPYDVLAARIREAHALGARHVRFSGGEPLLRRDIEDLIRLGAGLGLRVGIITNGALLTRSRMASLVAAGIDSITMSLDSLDPRVYESIRGLPYRQIEAVLDQFEEMWRNGSRIWTGISVVVTADNVADLPSMTVRLSRRSIPIQFQPCHSYSDAQENSLRKPSRQQMVALVASLIALKEQGHKVNNSRIYLEGMIDFTTTDRPPEGFHCSVPLTMAIYDCDMRLRPCCYPHQPIAGSDQMSLSEAWYSPEMDVWRERISRLDCHGCWLISLDIWK